MLEALSDVKVVCISSNLLMEGTEILEELVTGGVMLIVVEVGIGIDIGGTSIKYGIVSPLRKVRIIRKWKILDDIFIFRTSVMPEHQGVENNGNIAKRAVSRYYDFLEWTQRRQLNVKERPPVNR